jgi:hypothetical protein
MGVTVSGAVPPERCTLETSPRDIEDLERGQEQSVISAIQKISSRGMRNPGKSGDASVSFL